MIVDKTKSFKCDFKKLDSLLQKRFTKQIKLFLEYKKHPSLLIKKVKGTNGIFEARLSKSYRFTFYINDGVIVLRKIGEHDKVLKNP